jgi:6-pyruvoyltetrahydropterin/6-carboxytetrahydropterin synthase
MYQISKRFTFDASHQLHGLPEGHKCMRLHGHTYTVEVQLTAAALDPVGMVLDYAKLAPVKAYIDSTLDHQHLNDVLAPLELNPTAENLARFMHEQVVALLGSEAYGVDIAVGVSETPATWAWFRP